MAHSYPDAAAYTHMLRQYAPLIAAIHDQPLADAANGVNPWLTRDATVASTTENVTLSQAAAAVNQAMTLVSKEVATLSSVEWNFTGSSDMQAAMTGMEQSLSSWPTAMSGVEGWATAIVDFDGRTRSAVSGANDSNVTQQAQTLQADFASVTSLSAAAVTGVQQFRDGVASAYQQGSDANQVAAQNIQTEQQEIQQHIADLNAQISDLTSAGSIVLAIITFGITFDVKINDLNNQIASLNAEQAQLVMNETGYEVALVGLTNVFQAVQLLTTLLDTLSLAVEQLEDKLNDVVNQSSSNATVALALLHVFQSEVDDAAAQAAAIGS